MDTTQLQYLHDEIKNHPYRLNFDDSLKMKYRELLKEFGNESFKIYKEYMISRNMKDMNTPQFAPFGHDYNSAIASLYYRHPSKLPEGAWIFIESVISTIHQFLLYGEFTLIPKDNRFGVISYVFYSKTFNRIFPHFKDIIQVDKNIEYWQKYYEERALPKFIELKEQLEFIKTTFAKEDGTLEYY